MDTDPVQGITAHTQHGHQQKLVTKNLTNTQMTDITLTRGENHPETSATKEKTNLKEGHQNKNAAPPNTRIDITKVGNKPPPNSECLRTLSEPKPAQQTVPDHQKLQTQIEDLRNQRLAEQDRNQNAEKDLRGQLQNSQNQVEVALKRNQQITTDNDDLKKEMALLQTKLEASLERAKLIDDDNQHKSILYATALEKIHQLTEENKRFQTRNDTTEEQRHRYSTIQKENDDLRQQVKILQTQHPEELERNKREQQQLRRQFEKLQGQHQAAQMEHKQLAAASQEKLRLLQAQYDLLQIQHAETLQRNHQMANDDKKEILAKYKSIQTHLKRRSDLALITAEQLRSSSAHFRSSVSELRHTISAHFKGIQEEITSSSNHINTLATQSQPDENRVMELVQIEAFKTWMQKQPETGDQILAQILLQQVSAKLNHSLRSLKIQLQQTTAERDELQARIEQQEETRDTFGEQNRGT
jgi:hypothetical protein